MPILSIIIPIYNVEKYIDKCFTSIYNQGVSDTLFEVIAVNDGTPDESMKIVSTYSQAHGNLRIINKQNGGVSSARNKGIQISAGKYIMFVDPDDYLSERTLSPLISQLDNSSDDIIIFRSLENGKDYDLWFNYATYTEVLSGVELFEKGYRRGVIWGCCYSRNLILDNSILFPLGVKNCEDSIFFACCQMYAKRISFSNIQLYNIVLREGSATTAMTINNVNTYPDALDYINDLIKRISNNLTSGQCNIINAYRYGIISQWVYSALKVDDTNLKYLLTEQKIYKYLPIPYFKPIPLVSYLKIFLLNNFFPLYYLLCKIKFSI